MVVGRVRRVHGVRGDVVVEALTDVERRFAPGSQLRLEGERGPVEAAELTEGPSLKVLASRPYQRGILVTFEGIEDRDRAQALVGKDLSVPRARVPKARPGEYYHYQLVGCRCRDLTLGDLGEVDEVVEDGGGVLLIVQGARGSVPVPFVAAFLRSVDVEAGEIEVDLPPGLVDACAST